MDKLRALRSKLPSSSSPASSSLPGAKLSKAFKFNKDNNVLPPSESRWGTNPFGAEPSMEEPSLSRVNLAMLCVSLFFTFLAICMTSAVASFQAKWVKVSGGTGFVLFLLLITIVLNIILIVVPTVYDRWDKLKSANRFLIHIRSRLLLHAFGTLTLNMAAFIVTISAWTEPGCKNSSNDPHQSLGDDYTNGLSQWCQTKKASGVFEWISAAAWIVLMVLTIIDWRRDTDREPGFTPPDAGISSANVHERLARHQEEHAAPAAQDDPYAEKQSEVPLKTGFGSYGYALPKEQTMDDFEAEAFGRRSVDGYAYEGMESSQVTLVERTPGLGTGAVLSLNGASLGGANERSRTMQLAYDPYANIRQSLLSDGNGYRPVDPSQHSYQTVQQVEEVSEYQPVQQARQVQQVHQVQQVYPVQQIQQSPSAYGRGNLPQPPGYQSQGYGGY